jgi:HAD superfamily hydrolase (TIGR01549 family)
MNPIKAVIFDYDDTLVRTREIRYETIKKIAKTCFNTQMESSEIDSAWGLPGDSFLLKLFGKHVSNDLDKLWNIYNEYCAADPNQLHNGSVEFLEEFAHSVRYGILTSSSGKRVGTELTEIGLSKSLFIDVQTSEHTNVHKPNPLVFEPICEKFEKIGASRSAILYVGDTLADFKAATGFGLQFTGMAHTAREKAVFVQEGIDHVDGFAQLADFIRGRQAIAQQILPAALAAVP